MEIYWIKGKQRCGPASVPDVMDRIRLGELQPDTPGWHAGVQGWKPLRELPALADFLRDAPPAEQEPQELPEAEAPQPAADNAGAPGLPPLPGPQGGMAAKLGLCLPARLGKELQGAPLGIPTAGRRLLARAVDTLLYLTFALGAIYLVNAPYSPYLLPGSPIFWLPMIFLEAMCLCKWHSTPGKRLLGIYVCTLGDNPKMSYGRAFMRSFMAYILGMGMLSFPFFPIMPGIAYWVLRSRGICWWDMRVLTFPIAKHSGFSRILLSLGILYACLVAAGVFMKPWLTPMCRELQKADPAAAQLILNLLPELKEQISADEHVPQPLEDR